MEVYICCIYDHPSRFVSPTYLILFQKIKIYIRISNENKSHLDITQPFLLPYKEAQAGCGLKTSAKSAT